MLVLASVMLMAGGYFLVNGLGKLRDPAMVLSTTANEVADTEAEMQLNHRLAGVRAAALTPHRRMVKVEAVFEVLLAIYALYATAAVLSRDRRGRALSMGVGALGIVYHVATLPVYVSLMHDYAGLGADLLAQMMILRAGGTTTLNAGEIASGLRSAIVGMPILVSVISAGGSAILLAYFGGRRGRALYGVDGPPTPPPTQPG